MKRALNLVLLFILCNFFFSSQADAFQCVNIAGGGVALQAALDTAVSGDNEIRLMAGTYTIPGTPAVHFNIETARSLTITGGWNTGCSVQTADPAQTILQGGTLQVLGTYPDGGGVLFIYIFGNAVPATVYISNLTIQDGLAEGDGAGLKIQHDYDINGTDATLADVYISHVIVENNEISVFGYGSGISVVDWGTLGGINVTIADSLVQGNTIGAATAGCGGGIDVEDYGLGTENITISRSRIVNNQSDSCGGGLSIISGFGNAILVNNLIAGNSTLEDLAGSGGGIYIENSDGGDAILTNNTITDNTSTGDGGGISVFVYTPESVLDIYNNIIYNNTAAFPGADLTIYNPASPAPVVNLFYNDFDNTAAGLDIFDITNYAEAGNLNNSDPLFVNAASGDYHLQAGSPAIDEGDNFAPAVSLYDLDRNFRCNVDMGAYEYQGAVDGDADGLCNTIENNTGTYNSLIATGTDPVNPDSDGDLIPDGWEVANGLDPNVSNTGVDTDNDGYLDLVEFQNNTDPNIQDPPYTYPGYDPATDNRAFNLDIDGNGVDDALSDGLLIIRYLFDLRGDPLINGAVDTVNGTRTTAPDIEAFLAFGVSSLLLDIDGNGSVDALSDGLLIIRYLFGVVGDPLINGAVDTVNGTRTTAPAIEAYIQSIL